MRVWIQLYCDDRRHGDSLVDGASMRHFQESLSLFRGDSMRHVDFDVDTTDTVRTFGHAPFRIHAEAVSINAVSPAELPDEIRDTTCD
jgi:hypothetical protein